MDVNNIVNGSKEAGSSIIKKAHCPISGEGLPYAPVDWPNKGDIWGWKVGKRFDSSGSFYQDRFLVVPSRLQPHRRSRLLLRSKKSVKMFLQSEFPNAEIGAFFASFTWKVPVKSQAVMKANDTPSPRRRKSNKQEAVAPKDTSPSPQITAKQEAVAPKDTSPSPCPRKSIKLDVAAEDTPSPRPQKSPKQKAVAPKDTPSTCPRKSIKLEAAEAGKCKTGGKMIQKHAVHEQQRSNRRSTRLMGKFTTKYAGTLFDLTMESDEDI